MNNHTNKSFEEIDENVKDIAELLKSQDFSQSSNKLVVRSKVITQLNKRERRTMKLSRRTSIAFAVAIIGTMSFMQTTFAQEAIENIKQILTTGHIVAHVEEEQEMAVPESLQGKLFDKDGNAVAIITSASDLYTKDGEKVGYVDMKTGEVLNEAQAKEKLSEEEAAEEANTLVVKDADELNNYTCFEVKLPTYIPEGFAFDHGEFYKDENGEVKDSKYASIIFKNAETGKEIYMQQRFVCEETAYEMGVDKDAKMVKVNGYDAILEKQGNIEWETEEVMYQIAGRKAGLTAEEVVKMAESIK